MRRRDDVETVGRAIVNNATGMGHRRIAEALGRWENTVRRWLRAFRDRAELIRVHFTRWAYALDTDLGPIEPDGRAVVGAIEAIGVAARAWTQRYGPTSPWAVASRLTAGALLHNTNGPLVPLPAA